MNPNFHRFEYIVRRSQQFTEAETIQVEHPFDSRNIHPDFPDSVRRLFDDGHFGQATFEAMKFIDEEVRRIIGRTNRHGVPLMMYAFGGDPPPLKLNLGESISDRNEQEGFKFLFAGAIQAIRNPRGHSSSITDGPDSCLDYLVLSSLLLRRLDDADLRGSA